MKTITKRQIKKYSAYSTRKIISLQENGTLSDDDVREIINYANRHPPSNARKAIRRVKRMFVFQAKQLNLKNICSKASRLILWVCAVGGFLLSLIQFIQNK
ncbi:MAG: hypothetical protein KIC79_11475 [Firmicutes bacterium]|jgi:hypothetical protein|uniref:hypothetical protein n=1 Tax=Eubacterium callanderi TaxID=53442 RepID=UPI001D269420|nr:hypothetical protein [Bacillota bacterium]